MEIKKGISQMAEYYNVELNYVMPADGRMYYVLKDGILKNGCIIATLDPKYAIDEKNLSTSVGVFSESGEVLIPFDKKSIKGISDDLVLVENTKLTTPEVIGVSGKEMDPIVSQKVNETKENILMRMKSQMSSSGEILFSNPYSEANVYRLDSYNNKLGMDCSFIGKDETALFFHTNDTGSQIRIVEIEDFKQDSHTVVENLEEEMEPQDLNLNIDSDILNGFNIPEEDLEKVKNQEEVIGDIEEVSNNKEVPEAINSESKEESELEEIESEEKAVEDNSDSEEISLNIMNEEEIENDDEKEEKGMEKSRYKNKGKKTRNKSRTIDLDVEDYEEDIDDEDEYEIEETRSRNRTSKSKNGDKEEVLDYAIEVINKMIKETNKLKRRISLLEEQLQEKDEIIQESENKKDELNEILDKANEVLQKIG